MQAKLNRKALIGVSLTILLQACATNPNSADVVKNSNYVLNAEQSFVKSATDQCVRTGHWTGDSNIVECQSSYYPKVTQEPANVAVGSALVSFTGRALFEFDSAQITRSGKQQLHQLTRKLNQQHKITAIEIVGHTDSIGSDSYNLSLSEKRADAVKSYLQKSLTLVSVKSNGMGESAPIADNGTEQGRQMNRRVDVKIAAMQEQ